MTSGERRRVHHQRTKAIHVQDHTHTRTHARTHARTRPHTRTRTPRHAHTRTHATPRHARTHSQQLLDSALPPSVSRLTTHTLFYCCYHGSAGAHSIFFSLPSAERIVYYVLVCPLVFCLCSTWGWLQISVCVCVCV